MNLQGRNLHQDLTGDDVRLLHSELTLLKVVIPDTELQSGLFGPATVAAVQAFQKVHFLTVTGIVDALTARAISVAVDALRPPTSSVSGRVYSTRRAGSGGLQIQVLDKNVGPDVLLAKGVTGERGLYSVLYSTEALADRGKSAPDLQVRVLASDTLLGSSDVRYNASPAETLDVLVRDDAAAALSTEHDSLTSDIAAHFRGSLKDLQESDERSDITYLANKTGWDARAVALAALADQFSQRSGPAAVIPPSFFYALFRAGVPANEEVLYRTDAVSLRNMWQSAVDQGVIPASSANHIPTVVRQFQALSAQRLLTAPALAGVSSFSALLDASQLPPPQRPRFAALYLAHRDDMPEFWKAAGVAFGDDTAKRLQFDGKLAYLTLNHAPLMRALRQSTGSQALTDAVQLAQAGYHRAAKWKALLTADSPIPREIPGETADEKLANYADYLAAQIRLSYPTASIAHLVGELAFPLAPQVQSFLTTHQDKFHIGGQSVQQYVARNAANAPDPQVIDEIKKIERLYQITPNDQAMVALWTRGIGSASHIVHQDRDAFIQSLTDDVSAEHAALIYDRSVQVHNAVLNVAVSYITARNGFTLGAAQLGASGSSGSNAGEILSPTPMGSGAANTDVVAYPTLETLFGAMDFCACDHCRSMLSPAAYLVDLLQFIDKEPTVANKKNPQAALFARRPDIQHLPLTCENTNTPLPYIDLVNETLEYFVASDAPGLSLAGYAGHDTGGAATEDLMASPRHVGTAAYDILRGQFFPPPLPFHQPLESLRLHFDKLEVPLPLALERLRKTDNLERGSQPYGWRDILLEELRISREEYRLLTDGSLTLAEIYGFAPSVPNADIIPALSNAKLFARRVGVSYEELISILKTRFVNPNSELIPKLERLEVSFGTLRDFHEGTLTDEAFNDRLPQGSRAPNPAEYDSDIKQWVKQPHNFARIMSIITLVVPSEATAISDFGQFELRYSKPASSSSSPPDNLLGVADFVRLQRFIRLWKKLGWPIEHVDAAICALFRVDSQPVTAPDLATVANLDAGFRVLLPRLGVAVRVLRALHLTPQRDLLPLLACWSDITTHGEAALYRQLFLNPALLAQDPAFADDGYGNFPAATGDALLNHGEALRAALSLTADEFSRIVEALGFDGSAKLTLTSITAIYRRGWLARHLRMSVREFLLFSSLSGIDAFGTVDPAAPLMERLIALVQSLKARSLRPEAALYLIWNQDLSGKSAPDSARLSEWARTLRGDFAAIDDQFAVGAEEGGDLARARLALVYGEETTAAFFALLDGTRVLNVDGYTHGAPDLEPAIGAVDGQLGYDRFQHRLSHVGLVSTGQRDALLAVPGVSAGFQQAVDSLLAQSQDVADSLLARFPELRSIYEVYVASAEPFEEKRAALLAAFSPELAKRRKRQQALQRLATAASVDVRFAQQLLDTSGPLLPLHASGHPELSALDDITAIETQGLLASFYHRDTATGNANAAVQTAPDLAYSMTSNPLPANSRPGAAISGTWQGRVEAPETGYFNLVVEADLGATVTLRLDGQLQPLVQLGTVWRNGNGLRLEAGVLYDVTLTVAKVKELVRIQWESPKRAREVIPGRYLYPPHVFGPFADAYVRFLKVAALATTFRLTAGEVVHFATDPTLVDGNRWLNGLSVTGTASPAVNASLVEPLESLLAFARIKAELSPDDEQVLEILKHPTASTASTDSALFSLTGWDRASLLEMLVQFGKTTAGLSDFRVFRRVYDAFAVVQAIEISSGAAFRAATNAPTPEVVREFEAALRARYDSGSWRELVQPIHDSLRSLQRDALVAHVLHQMGSNPDTVAIDTPDKLFEYFLMDVEMAPCMQTSRVRHALSTLQLFIERCCMNLEGEVSPSSINRQRWAAMKRYRTWEANRKVFLYPENWLEPELRDDKSPFFKEIESLLLQSDITEDSASSAFITYLSRLEEVAKLEPCGMHYVEPGPTQGRQMHVVARTAGAHRKYYYRRLEHGTWTAWDPIKLDIPDKPVVPVVWQDRLFLFWLKLLKNGPQTAPQITPTKPPPNDTVASLTLGQWSRSTRQPSFTSSARISSALARSVFPPWAHRGLRRLPNSSRPASVKWVTPS